MENQGIGGGDRIDLRGNPLSEEAIETHIPALRDRGVSVLFNLFRDENLQLAVAYALGKYSDEAWQILPSDVQGLARLEAPSRGIRDLSGLERCTNLTELDLSDNEIEDISALGSFTNLKSLNLSHNLIQDISPLRNLSSLQHGVLNLSYNRITDISPLLALPHLEALILTGNPLDRRSVEEILPQLEQKVDVLSFEAGIVEGRVELEGRGDFSGAEILIDGRPVLQTSPSGELWFAAETGDHKIRIKKPGYLSVEIEVKIEKDKSFSLPEIKLIGGDVNGDDRIDEGDLSTLGMSFNLRVEAETSVDINGDGFVDIYDLVMIGKNFGLAAGQIAE